MLNNRELSFSNDLVCVETTNLSTPFHNFIFNESEVYTINYYEHGHKVDVYDAYITQGDITHIISKRFIDNIFLSDSKSREFVIDQIIKNK